MKVKYTKKQIEESIKYWQRKLDESSDFNDDHDTREASNRKELETRIEEFAKAFSNASVDDKLAFMTGVVAEVVDQAKLKSVIKKLRAYSNAPGFKSFGKLLDSFMYYVMSAKQKGSIDLDNWFDHDSGHELKNDPEVYESKKTPRK